MKKRLWLKLLSVAMAIITTAMSLPLQAFAQTVKSEEVLYLKEVRLAQAETREEAKISLEDEGFTFLDSNLNEGTDEEGVWLGYTTTTDPTEAIYDMKLMNMNGGFTLTRMEEVLKSQETAFAEMASDLKLLIDEFVEAYRDDLVPAQKAYKALNFFRMIEGETEFAEANGLGYHLVHGGMTTGTIIEMIMFCDPTLVDSIVKILTMGIQAKNENWMKKLSAMGPYDDDVVYGLDEKGQVRLSEDEVKRRAKQLETVLEFYANAYSAFNKAGLVSGTFDDNFNIKDATYQTPDSLTPDELAAKKADESRYKLYKVVYDELATYSYGSGETLKDLFKSPPSSRDLYPLVSVLSDGEFAALSYGCFLEVATGASATAADFDCYDQVYAEATADVDPIYLYIGVDKALLDEDSLVAFTETATRHMASTGELEFFENDTLGEKAMTKGKLAAKILGAIGLCVMGVTKVTAGVLILTTGIIAAATGVAVKSAVCAGVIKVCSVIGGPWTLLITAAVVAVTFLVSWLIYVIDKEINGTVDWDENPMPEYIYDVREINFVQKSENEGITTDYVKRPAFGFYEAVRDENGQIADLNARSKDSSQWIGLYVSYDCLGDDAKPIKAEDLKVQTGNGEAPSGYKPLTRFSEIVAYNLNLWDDEDAVNGVYMFYKQDENAPAVEKNATYYISEVYLQKGESPAHCTALLRNAGYTPLNVNLSPDPQETGFSDKKVCTYLGYKTTTNPNSAIRDMRLVYGPNQGEIKLGGANYSECGSNDWVTLYSTKYTAAGSPILAGGIRCVNDRDNAPAGYEPVNFFGGGPAVSFNYRQRYVFYNYSFITQKGIEVETPEFFLYFLPEQSFTEGTKYVGGISYFYVNNDTLDSLDTSINFWGNDDSILRVSDYMQKQAGQSWESYYKDNGGLEAMMRDYLIVRSGYHTKADANHIDSVVYYETYNPYRAIYDIKGTSQTPSPTYFSFENLGYVSWNTLHLSSIAEAEGIGFQPIFVDCNELCTDVPLEMAGRFYVSGNPGATNVYNSATGEMSETQPLKVGEVICDSKNNPLSTENMEESSYQYINDVFRDGQTAIVQNNADRSSDYDYGINTFKFYVAKKSKDRPYVTNVSVADELTVYRAAGGHDAGVKREYITDDMLYKHLAAQGATNFCGHRVSMGQATSQELFEMNALLFGYTRSSTKRTALTDMFLYVNDFSFDEPPTTMSRGNVDYTLLCQIPYNLTGYDGAPGPCVWLYGTTNTKAGARIIDFEISGSPFLDGYETIRTKDGRSPWSQICEMAEKNKENHFLGWAQEVYEELLEFFTIMDLNESWWNNYFEHAPYYLHIKREGDPITEQKPYVEQLYLAEYTGHQPAALEKLFDMGAEEYFNIDLNKDAGGQYILLGYSRTASVEKAIKDIRAYHKKNPPQSMTSSEGVKYTLPEELNLDLNYDAGGDYIYLFTTKTGSDPITQLDVSFAHRATGSVSTETGPNETEIQVYERAVTMWNTNTYSNLNADAGGVDIYLYQKKVCSGAKDGSYTEPNWGKGLNKTRSGFDKDLLDPNGKYIAELYIMDKETIRKEKNLLCNQVGEQEVFDRLTQMGATEILKTPISVNCSEFDDSNDNKVYIGFSRTNNEDEAIKDIAIQVELISNIEPQETISIDKKTYSLVAESASKVAELPKAINLLAIGDGRQVAFPKMYLYTSTSGNLPGLTDMCIDQMPLLNGWNTVRSTNGLNPFVDVQNQAYEQYQLADKDDLDSYDKELVYTDPLFEWMDDVSEIFDPEEKNVSTFYIHTKNSESKTIEEEKPYIEEVYLAAGDSRLDALSQLTKFNPDGFVDIDLNRRAGGKYVYLAYKRTDKASAALRDLMICKGADPETPKRVTVNGTRVRYDLVADVDLNARAGGSYLYLYASNSSNVGNPILSIEVVEDDVPYRYVYCGVEVQPVFLVEDNRFTNECIDLNKGAGGDYLYMYMRRETTEGHMLIGYNKRTEHKDPTCGKNGYDRVIETCYFCRKDIVKETVLPATGKHVDDPKDGDHRCDVCRQRDVSNHVRGLSKWEYVTDATCTTEGFYHERYYCVDCDDLLSDKIVTVGINRYCHVDANYDNVCDLCGVTELGTHAPGRVEQEKYKAPTCGQKGSYLEVTYCFKCGKRYEERVVELEATGEHVYGQAYAYDHIEPSCSEKGSYREVVQCAICGLPIAERIVDRGYDYSKHTPAEPVEENRIEPTADADGSYQKVVYCSGCGKKLSEETVVLPATSEKATLLGSLMGEGSVFVLCILTAGAVLVAFIIFLRKKKKK